MNVATDTPFEDVPQEEMHSFLYGYSQINMAKVGHGEDKFYYDRCFLRSYTIDEYETLK